MQYFVLIEEYEENVRTIIDKLPLVSEKMIRYAIIALTLSHGYERLFLNNEVKIIRCF
jgi:hypothetical protein